MSTDTSIQLSLFDDNTHEPHPLIVAHKYNFPLAYIDRDGNPDHYIYPCQDWYKGTSGLKKGWKQLKSQLVTSNDQLEIIQAPYIATDGKTYQADYTTAHGLYIIIQHIRVSKQRPQVQEIKQYLAQAGVFIDQARRNPQMVGEALLSIAEKRRLKEIGKYERAGFGKHPKVEHLKERHEGIDTLKSLLDLIAQVCDKPNYAQFFDTEALAMFGKHISDLRQILDTKSVRDALPALQLSYLRTAELGLYELIRNSGAMTNEQLLERVRWIVEPLGNHLKTLCDMLGIHQITGLPLLNDGKES